MSGSPDTLDALLSFLAAACIAWLLVPPSEAIAKRLGAIDEPRARSLHDVPTPRLGGLAILVAVLVSGAIWLPWNGQTRAILAGAAAITALGALDDIYELGAAPKLLGQIAASTIPVLAGIRVETLNFLGFSVPSLGWASYPLTVLGIVAIINMINFIDGVDGLASGVCAIAAMAFAVIALSLDRGPAGVLAALTAGASLGFLRHGFPPASSFMGDTGSNLLGYLLAVVVVQGALKTNAVLALALPLLVLAVPIFDASFVVARRVKYRQPVYRADRSHLHHRMANIGFSQRRTLAYLYGWTLVMAGLALALRFIPYHLHGRWHLEWAAVLALCGLIALAASAYLIYVLEILKLRRVRLNDLRGLSTAAGRLAPSPEAIDRAVAQELETGSFPVIDPETGEFETLGD
jgi:UDP-GlcNAc:undecaprenyl-phosphate/decaprenyl-phosphate GlcNAc-1-phosphate transferase